MTRLHAIADDIWMHDGGTVSFFGVPYPTRMVLVRLPGGLWVWSPTVLDPELEAEVRALAEVRWVVEPNKIHHLFLRPWLEAFPEARAYAPPGLAARKPEISFAGELGDVPEPDWGGQIDQVVVGGSLVMDEVLFFHRPSSTCIVGDLIQRHEPEAFSVWQRYVMWVDGLLGAQGSTPREWRATFVRRGPARAALQRVLAWNAERLVIAHGTCALSNGHDVLRRALAWITRPWPV